MNLSFGQIPFSYISTKHGSYRTAKNYWNSYHLIFHHCFHAFASHSKIHSVTGPLYHLSASLLRLFLGLHQRMTRNPTPSNHLAFYLEIFIPFHEVYLGLRTSLRLPQFNPLRCSEILIPPWFRCQQWFVTCAPACLVLSYFGGTWAQDQAASVHYLYCRVASDWPYYLLRCYRSSYS